MNSDPPAGGVLTVHLLPFQISARAPTVCAVLTAPVAMQYVVLAHDTLSKPSDVAPAGMTGLIRVHDLPFHSSATAPATPGTVPPEPTATQ